MAGAVGVNDKETPSTYAAEHWGWWGVKSERLSRNPRTFLALLRDLTR